MPPRSTNHRVTKACARCRHRKTRCDLKYPTCGSCAQAKVSCVGYDSVHRRERPRSTVAHLEEKVAALEIELSRLKSEQAVDSRGLVKESIANLGLSLAQTISGEMPSKTQRTTTSMTKSPLMQLDSPIHLMQSPLPPLCDDAEQGVVVPSEGTERCSNISLIPRHVVDIMLSNYTEIYLPQSPYLEVSQLYSSCDKIFSEESELTTPFDTFSVAIALAISATTLMRHDEERATSAALEFWNTAKSQLARISEDSQPLEKLRALLLVTHYGFVNPQAVNVWTTVGAATRLALKIGLHHELPAVQRATLDDIALDLRRKLFWAAYSVDAAVHFVIGRAFIYPRSAVTAKYPDSIFGDRALGESEASPVTHTWPLRQFEAETSCIISKTGVDLSDELSIPIDQWRTQAIQRIEAWYALTHTSADGRPGEKIEFRGHMYHTNLFRLNCPSPRFPEPTVEMRKKCLNSIIALASSYSHQSRLGRLFYIWHAVHQLFECGVCLLETILSSVRSSMDGGPSFIAGFESAVLTRTVKTIPQLLRNISKRWPPVVSHARFLEDCSTPVLDYFKRVSGGRRFTTMAMDPVIPVIGEKLRRLLIPSPKPAEITADELLATTPSGETANNQGILQPNSSLDSLSVPLDPPIGDFFLPDAQKAWPSDLCFNQAAESAATANFLDELPWDFPGMELDQIFAAFQDGQGR